MVLQERENGKKRILGTNLTGVLDSSDGKNWVEGREKNC